MKADGDDRSVCFTKLDWLDPKWHGSDEEMLAFGQACRETKNWWAGITLCAADAHFRHAARLEPAEMPKYLSKPEVWTEIKLVYDEYLSHHPHDDVERSKYAALCYLARHYLEAHAQFDALGDRLTAWPHFPNYPLAYLKKIRDEVAKIDASRPRGDGPTGGWIPFNARNDEGRWSARFPVVIQRRQEGGILGVASRNVFTCTAEGITYTIRVQLVPPEAKSGEAKLALDAARDAIAREHGGRVLDEHRAALGEYPAEEYRIDAPPLRPAVLRVRSGVIGNRLYELSVRASATDVSGAAATGFLDSFKFQR